MTREEAIARIRDHKIIHKMNEPRAIYISEALDMAIKALEQEPKTDIALERYKDLQDYFSDENIAKAVLENQTEFKAWLERLHWNTKKVDELARKLEALEQEPKTDVLDKIRAEIEEKYYECDICKWVEEKNEDDTDISDYSQVGTIQGILQIIDKYKQTEPRTGRWIREIGYDICSECGSHTIAGRKYCPECGSYNVVEGEQND